MTIKPNEISEIMQHSKIHEWYRQVEFFRFYYRDTQVEIQIKIWETARGEYYYTTSHHIKTPTQAGPYTSSRRTGSSIAEALRKAINDIDFYFDSAVRAGHEWEPEWFVPSPYF